MAEATTLPDPYATLGLGPKATPAEIKLAFRNAARRHHPDLNAAPGATGQMAAINAAHALLSDPARRAAHDAQHLPAPPTAPPDTDNFQPGLGRAFERPQASNPSGFEPLFGSTAPA